MPSDRPSVFTPFFRRFTNEGQRELEETIALYNEVQWGVHNAGWSGPDAIDGLLDRVKSRAFEIYHPPSSSLVETVLDGCTRELIEQLPVFNVPEIDWDTAMLTLGELVALRQSLRTVQHFLANLERLEPLILDTLGDIHGGFGHHLRGVGDETETPLSIPLYTLLSDPAEMIELTFTRFTEWTPTDTCLFETVKSRFYENMCRASNQIAYEEHRRPLTGPTGSRLPPDEMIETFLAGTPFYDLMQTRLPFELPERNRFEHHWIVAGSGHGKTQCLQTLIAGDLDQVANGEASIIVIDSQGDLIQNIARLKVFAPGEPLHGKLCLIDPTDIEYPVALNLFDVGMERINSYSPLDRERLINGVLELYDFVLASLLSAGLTQKQGLIFRYITRLMLQIPDATIHTFRELMEKDGDKKYRPYTAKLTGTARAFFETEFNSKEFEDTKRQVVRRLWGILENQTFERMFSHPRNKLDLFKEMNAGKVILINTAKELLKQNGTEIFGRFFIAMIAQAAQERATLHPSDRTPTFVYVDECQDYLDSNVSLILEQARKQNVGMILAHQYIGQLSPKLQESFSANTSIKFAGGVSDRDARTLAPMLRTKPEFIEEQRKGQFAAFVRNVTDSALSLSFPFGYMEDMERMDRSERSVVLDEMRARYAVHYTEVEQQISERMPEAPLRVDPDQGEHTEPSSKW